MGNLESLARTTSILTWITHDHTGAELGSFPWAGNPVHRLFFNEHMVIHSIPTVWRARIIRSAYRRDSWNVRVLSLSNSIASSVLVDAPID